MTVEEFKVNYDRVKDLVKGLGPEIANQAGLPYNSYYNVIRGQVTDPEKIKVVWNAMMVKVNELMSGAAEIE